MKKRHENTYTDELASSDCNQNDGNEKCYAYAEPQTTDAFDAVADGANDMNWCFYVDKIGTNPVINKFGAAATFGPTLADTTFIGNLTIYRDGSLSQTANALTQANIFAAMTSTSSDFFAFIIFAKQYVDSHYFYAPSPGAYDLHTAFAFVFPFKHFIGEKETIQAVEIYDNSENTTTVEIGKFISPGLPTAPTYADEASIFFLSPPFNEGWIRFEVSATNSTAKCFDLFEGAPGEPCEVLGLPASLFGGEPVPPPGKYVPGYNGIVFTTGSGHIGASPFNYNIKITE